MYFYEYIDDTPRDFPTLGLREVAKGQQVESEEPLNSPFLKAVTPPNPVQSPITKGSEE